MPPRMKEKFNKEVAPKVAEKFGIKNRLALPRLTKIVINCGMGKELDGTKIRPQVREQVLNDLAAISGQKAVMIASRKSVANFKVREGYETHAMVTLRGARMWEFFDRLFSLAIPRVKDFRGLSDKGMDKSGNWSFGVTEQGIFPEINMADAQYSHGMNFNFVFENSDAQKSKFLLAEMGVPFVKPENN
ncbi:MAG: 50S ribosomal protein L5 [Planctomycetes bacterium]|nr:50S ribosomal protein L5 [Planctomycetota bacterium]